MSGSHFVTSGLRNKVAGRKQNTPLRRVCAWTGEALDGLGPVADDDVVSHGISPAGEAIFFGKASAWPRKFESAGNCVAGQSPTPCVEACGPVGGAVKNDVNALAAGGLCFSKAMKTATNDAPAFVGMIAARVAQITGLSAVDIYRLHSDDMGSPGHFRYDGGDLIYTPRGLRRLIEIMDAERQTVAARALAAAVERIIEHRFRMPSPPPMPRKKQWWQRGAMA